ncbi:MAG: LysR substrate-binding domain-containing protein [Burkholderiaceae bacterium]
MLTHALAMETEVLTAQRRLAGRDEQLVGPVRVSTVDDLVIHVLGAILRDFSRQHRRVRLDVAVSSGHADLAQQQADVAIRPGEYPKEGDVIARRLCAVGVALYASPEYLARHGRPNGPHDWATHRIVRGDDSVASIPMERFVDRFVPASAAVFRSHSMHIRQNAVREGLGIGLLPCFAADSDSGLVRLGETWPQASAVLWIIVHADLRHNARVRAFVAFVQEALMQMKPRFEGSAPARWKP